MQKLHGIQVGRGLAAISIAYFHSWVALQRFPKDSACPIHVLAQYGWLAVDVFFAISGFVICLTITKYDFSPARFLKHRALRLYPLWWLTLCTFAGLTLIWRHPTERETIGFFLYSATLLPTEHFPYYDLGWSLQHEMMFYLAAALIVPVFGLAGIVAFLTISTVAVHTLPLPWPIANLATYHAEFLAGVLAFAALRWTKQLGTIVLLSLGAATLYFVINIWGGRDFVPASLFFLISGMAAIRADKSNAMRYAVSLGDASYSIYLWHPIVFSCAYAATTLVSFPVWAQEPIRIACFVAIVVLSAASYRLFERPIMDITRRQR